MKSLLLLLPLAACGFNGNQSLEVKDSTQHIVNSGTATFSIEFSFISEIKALCEESLATTAYADATEKAKAVADCTFAKLAILSANPKDSVCSADRTGLPPDQLAQILALCGGN